MRAFEYLATEISTTSRARKDKSMKFFVPLAELEKAESIYAAIKKFVSGQMGPLSDRRYHSIYYRHNGKDCVARVGEQDPLTGTLIIAIFRSADERLPFYICTPDRGVARGSPIFASSVGTRAIEFETD